MNIGYWPPNVPREESVEAFVMAYESLGYTTCVDGSFEVGFEKVALYADLSGTPTHAAIQLASGKWSSKLGDFEDIEHNTPEVVGGGLYGHPVRYLKRPF